MNQFEGSHPRMAMGIEVMWKPCLWYVKRAYPQGRGFIRDGLVVSGNGGQDKSSGHKWEQDTSWSDFFVSKLTFGDDALVLDPFVGSGTTLISAANVGRKSIGIDSDPASCEIAANRCANDMVERLRKGEVQR